MLRVIDDGPEGLRLENGAGARIGWIRGRAIVFDGFATEVDAIRATLAAWRALGRALRQQYPGWPRYEPAAERIHVFHDGTYEWISDGTSPLARLRRPAMPPTSADDSFGLEFVLPSYASEGLAVAAAHAIWRVLAEHAEAAREGAGDFPPAA